MLVLTRNPGESIIIGDTVKVIILSKIGRQVKIGIEAPKEISVHREEIYEKLKTLKLLENKKEGDKNAIIS